MKKVTLSLTLLITLLITGVRPVAADVTIGNGFTCSGSSILKGDKTIPYSKAKSNITTTISKLRQKLQNTTNKKKKEAIREQLKEANNSKTLLKSCSNGELSDNQVDTIFTQLSSGTGTYAGTYSGLVNGLLPISGPITLQFALDQTTFSASLTLEGNLSKVFDNKPLTFSADVGGVSFPAQFNLPDTFIGSVTLSVTQDGRITITNTGSADASISFDGQVSNSSISAALSGSYKSETFEGTATLSK